MLFISTDHDEESFHDELFYHWSVDGAHDDEQFVGSGGLGCGGGHILCDFVFASEVVEFVGHLGVVVTECTHA